MSNPEFALYLEKEHLRDAEESDYLQMEKLIQRQYEDDEFPTDQNPQLLTVVQETREFRNTPRSLRRSSAVESDLTPMHLKEVSFPSCSKDETVVTITRSPVPQRRNDSRESDQTESSLDDTTLLVSEHQPTRPTIVVDSSQLPTLQRILPKTNSKSSLHMQTETMC